MKKKLFVISSILFLAAATGVNAQSGLEIGVRLNPEFTGILNKNDADAGAELDFKSHYTLRSFGLGAVYNFNKNTGIAIDLLFSREGQAFSGYFNGSPLNATAYSAVVGTQVFLNGTPIAGNYVALAELNYFKIPIMLSLTSDNSKPLFFTLLAGPQINFLESAVQEVNHKDLDYPNTNFTSNDLYHTVTLGGVLALGAAYNLSSHFVLSARVRFDYGFTDAEKKDVMVSYFGAEPVHFYSSGRKSANSMSTGLMLGLDFKL